MSDDEQFSRGWFRVGDLTVIVSRLGDDLRFLGLMIGDGPSIRFRLTFHRGGWRGMCQVYHQGPGKPVIAGHLMVNPEEHLTDEYRAWINQLNSQPSQV